MDTEVDVSTSLKDLPGSLLRAYDEIYQCILNQKKSAPQLALHAFRWVKFSYEALASKTLLHAVGAQVSKFGEYIQEPIETDTILKVCQNLLVLDERLDTFRFAHLPVEEYLETKFLAEGSTEADCHAYIAKTCLSLLCSPSNFEKYDHKVVTHEGEYRNRHLLLYSAAFWPWHYSCYEALQKDGECEALVVLWEKFTAQSIYRGWIQYYRFAIKTTRWGLKFWQNLHSFRREQESPDPLFLACIFGLGRRFKALFKARPDVTNINMDYLLFHTCRFGYTELVQYLFDNGATGNLSTAGKCMLTPLHLASKQGHEAVARLLLDKGAEVSAIDMFGATPLHIALTHRHEAIAMMLLDRGANIFVTSEYGRSWTGEAKMFLDKRAKVSVLNNCGSTPLHLASEVGHEAVATLLLEKCAEVFLFCFNHTVFTLFRV